MTTRMALRQREQGNTLLGGNKINQEGGFARIPGKARANSSSARSALVNISNKGTSNNANTNVQLKEAVLKARANLSKTTGTTSLKSVIDKENPLPIETAKGKEEAVKDELRKLEPCKEVSSPMDTSSQQIEAYSKQLLPDNVANIDKDDSENPQLVSEYVNDIYDYMHDLERKFNVRSHFLEGQEINGRMRAILYDWLVQVHLRFHLLQETLYLTTAIIDRFLQIQKVSKNKLQLVGVTSMLIASKYEEMYAPEIADFVYITDNAYTKADIRAMECCILRTLDFSLGRPLPLHFLRRNSKAGDVDTNHHTMAKYLMELTLIDYDMAHYHPSEIAAAALCLSMKLYDGEEANWSDTLQFYSKYSEEHLLPIMQRMALLVTKAGRGKCTAIKTKYSSAKFMRISSAPQLKSDLITDLAASVPSL